MTGALDVTTSGLGISYEVYSYSLPSGLSVQSKKLAFPPGPDIDADANPMPLLNIANASIVLTVTAVTDLENATFTYGTYGKGINATATVVRPPQADTRFVIDGQRLTFAVAREGNDVQQNAGFTVQVELIGDFCQRVPADAICVGHNTKATAPPVPSRRATGSRGESGNTNGSKGGANDTINVPSVTPASGASARRVVLSAVVMCLAIAATAL